VGALLAAMQRHTALRTIAIEIGSRGELSGAIEASCRGNSLNQARKPRAGHINGWARALLSGSFVAIALGFKIRTLGVHVPPLFVPAITIHGEVSYSLKLFWAWFSYATLMHPGS
jgi:hypothetical protein